MWFFWTLQDCLSTLLMIIYRKPRKRLWFYDVLWRNMFKKTLFVLFSISFHTFTAKTGKRMHSKHPLPSSFAENSWRGKRSDWLTLPFPATKKPKCHKPGINLNSSSPFLISPHLIITPLPPSLPPSFLLHPSPLSYSPPAPPKKYTFIYSKPKLIVLKTDAPLC